MKIRKRLLTLVLSIAMILTQSEPTFVVKAASPTVLNGDYILIQNKSLTQVETTGTIVYDDTNIVGGSPAGSATPVNIQQYDMNLGITNSYIPSAPPYKAPPSYVVNTSTLILGGKTYTLRAIGQHCYVWSDAGVSAIYGPGPELTEAAQNAINTYDNVSYPQLKKLGVDSKMNYADGSGKLSIIFEQSNTNASAYFASADMSNPTNPVTDIHISINAPVFAFGGYAQLFAHEGQHALNASTVGLGSWINEGLSVAAMDMVSNGTDSNNWLNGVADDIDVRSGAGMAHMIYTGNNCLDYSLGFAFIRYLNTQANGISATSSNFYTKLTDGSFYNKIYSSPTTGEYSGIANDAAIIENVMSQYDAFKNPDGSHWTFTQAISNFRIALMKQDPTGIYGFYGDTVIKNKVGGPTVYFGTSGKGVNLGATGAIIVKTVNGSFTVPVNAGPDVIFTAFNYTQPVVTNDPMLISGNKIDPVVYSSQPITLDGLKVTYRKADGTFSPIYTSLQQLYAAGFHLLIFRGWGAANQEEYTDLNKLVSQTTMRDDDYLVLRDRTGTVNSSSDWGNAVFLGQFTIQSTPPPTFNPALFSQVINTGNTLTFLNDAMYPFVGVINDASDNGYNYVRSNGKDISTSYIYSFVDVPKGKASKLTFDWKRVNSGANYCYVSKNGGPYILQKYHWGTSWVNDSVELIGGEQDASYVVRWESQDVSSSSYGAIKNIKLTDIPYYDSDVFMQIVTEGNSLSFENDPNHPFVGVLNDPTDGTYVKSNALLGWTTEFSTTVNVPQNSTATVTFDYKNIGQSIIYFLYSANGGSQTTFAHSSPNWVVGFISNNTNQNKFPGGSTPGGTTYKFTWRSKESATSTSYTYIKNIKISIASNSTPTVTPTVTPRPTTPTPTAVPTTPTSTPIPTINPGATPSPTPSLTTTPSITPSITPSTTPSSVPSITPTLTPVLTETPNPSPEVTVEPESSGQISFFADTFSGYGGKTAGMTMIRSGGCSGEVEVTWTATGTAEAGTDFTGETTGTVLFANGEKSKTIVFPINQTATNGRTIILTISSPTGNATLGDLKTATLNIQGYVANVKMNTIKVLKAVNPNLEIRPGTSTEALVLETLSNGAGINLAGSDVTWSSTNPAIATVNSGMITGVAFGTTNIKATYEKKTVTFKVITALKSLEGIDTLGNRIPEPGSGVTTPIIKLPIKGTTTISLKAKHVDLVDLAITEGATWSTSNAKIATVSSEGTITVMGAGTCYITGKYGSKKVVAKVDSNLLGLNVSYPDSSSPKVIFTADGGATIPAVLKMKAGDVSAAMIVTATYADGTTANIADNSDVKWATTKSTIATVDNKGQITTSALLGTATITATYFGKKTSVKVITGLNGLTANKTELNLKPSGDTATITLTADYANGNSDSGNVAATSVVWKSLNKKIATVDSNGVVTTVGVGTTKVTAVYGAKTVYIAINTNVALAYDSSASVTVGENKTVTLTATYADGTTEDVTTKAIWTSSKAAIASVSAGQIMGVKKGTAKIMISYLGVKKTIAVTVS